MPLRLHKLVVKLSHLTAFQMCWYNCQVNYMASFCLPAAIGLVIASPSTFHLSTKSLFFIKLLYDSKKIINSLLEGSNLPTSSKTCFLGPTWVHILNSISTGSAAFAQLTAECLYTLQLGCPFPPQTFARWILAPSNTWFLGLSQVHIPNGISISSDRDRLTNRQTPSETIGCIYVVLRCSLKSNSITAKYISTKLLTFNDHANMVWQYNHVICTFLFSAV